MANKAIFLDRDDTIIEDPGYINDPDDVKLLPGAAETLASLAKMGYKLVVVTNQSAVARGIVSEEVLEEIHQRLETLMSRQGVYLDAIYYCPYHPEGVIGKYRRQSDLRKPNPGMLLSAARDMNIDLSASWMIGNSYSDVAAGARAGCKTILISSSPNPPKKDRSDPDPDKVAVNIKEAVNIIKMFQRTTRVGRPRQSAGRSTAAGAGRSAGVRSVEETVSVAEPTTEVPQTAEAEAAEQTLEAAVGQETKKPSSRKTQTEKVKRAASKPRTTKAKTTKAKTTKAKTTKAKTTKAKTTRAKRTIKKTTARSKPQPEPKIQEVQETAPVQAPVEAKPPVEAKQMVEVKTVVESKPAMPPTEEQTPQESPKTQEVLEEVVRYLKQVDRLGMYEEFSLIKVLAGVAQVVVFFLVLLSVWFLLDPTYTTESVRTVLAYAAVLQLMAIGFYLMRDRR